LPRSHPDPAPLVARFRALPAATGIAKALRAAPRPHIRAGGLWGASAQFLIAALAGDDPHPWLFVLPGTDDAETAAEDLATLLGPRTRPFPAWESLPGESLGIDPGIFSLRLAALADLARPAGPPPVIVASAAAVLQPVLSREEVAHHTLSLRVGQTIPREDLLRRLVEWEMERTASVEFAGEFAVRGYLVDLFPHGLPQPVRLEFYGDVIESIRVFDLTTQVSQSTLQELSVPVLPRTRFFATSWDKDCVTLLDHLSPAARVVILEPSLIRERLDHHFLPAPGMGDGPPTPRAPVPLEEDDPTPGVWFLTRTTVFPRIELAALPLPETHGNFNFNTRSTQRFSGDLGGIFTELRRLLDECDEVAVFCGRPAEADRLREILVESGMGDDARLAIVPGVLAHGFQAPAGRFAVLPNHELFHRYRLRRAAREARQYRPIESFLELERGDYVVHIHHGIGRYEGLVRKQEGDQVQEFLVVEYLDRVKLSVPVSQIDLVQKYVGSGEEPPELSKVGGAGWEKKKAKAREACFEMAKDLLEVQAMREKELGIAFEPDTPWQHEFEASFPFEDTEDQIEATVGIKRDMMSAKPMDRLVCGDVGYGKTELAIRAAFKAAIQGKQVAVLVPTTVLAQQHGLTFTERMADYPVVVEVLSRFRSRAETKSVLDRLADGSVDIVIGTHRLLGKDVKFSDLGLIVVDEEQRFGVEHKERLKRLRATVDILTLTATPIPRTLHMSLLGIRDISVLQTPPQNRQAIRTEVCRYDRGKIRLAILRELERDGQVFFVHNRVYDIETVADEVRGLVPEARVGVVHGQMEAEEIEEHMLAFVEKRTNVLVATTIIESGLDIPSANTMIIHDADQYGLADLHQLRGRVGRYKHQAYAYFLLPEGRPMTREGERRLRAIEEFHELGAGFRIAMRDMEIRGAGNILGKEQHGHIAAVGYDLYCTLLSDSVRALKNQRPETRIDTAVTLKGEAFLPEDYAPVERERIDLYRRLCRAQDAVAVEAMVREMEDRYGRLPDPVQRLVELTRLRIAAQKIGLASLTQAGQAVICLYVDPKLLEPIHRRRRDRVRIVDEQTVHFVLSPREKDLQSTIAFLIQLLSGGTPEPRTADPPQKPRVRS